MAMMAAFISGKPIMCAYTPAVSYNAGDVVIFGNCPFVAHGADPTTSTQGTTVFSPQPSGLSARGGIYQMAADVNTYIPGDYLYWSPALNQVTSSGTAQNTVPFGWVVGLGTNDLSDTAASTQVAVLHDPTDDTGQIYTTGAVASDYISNTGSETAFLSNTIIPASTLQAGDVIHVRATALQLGQNSTNTTRLRLEMLTAANTFTTILDTGAVNAAANAFALLDANIMFTAVGNSGAFYATGDQQFGAVNTANRQGQNVTNTAVNTGTAITLRLTALQSAASATNNTQCLEFLSNKIRK